MSSEWQPTEKEKEIVEAGVLLLDEAVAAEKLAPEWWNRVDLVTLDMHSIQNCVLAQLFGTYGDGAAAIGFNAAFQGRDRGLGWRRPNATWRKTILRLREERNSNQEPEEPIRTQHKEYAVEITLKDDMRMFISGVQADSAKDAIAVVSEFTTNQHFWKSLNVTQVYAES